MNKKLTLILLNHTEQKRQLKQKRRLLIAVDQYQKSITQRRFATDIETYAGVDLGVYVPQADFIWPRTEKVSKKCYKSDNS